MQILDKLLRSTDNRTNSMAETESSDKAQTTDRTRTKSAGSTTSIKVQWSSVLVAAAAQFLVAVQFSIYFASLWPYLTLVDKTADQTFYGFVLAAYSAGQMIGSPIFGYWSTRIKKARWPVIVGICFALIGNLIYIFTEAFDSNRKWIILVSRALCGVGGGVSGTIRAYMATSTAVEYRSKVIAIGTASLSIGIMGGPIIQAIVEPIKYPGYGNDILRISEYTAPSYVSIAVCIIAIALMATVFRESSLGVDEKKKKDPYHVIPKYDRFAALICIWCWFAMFFCITNNETVGSPYTMAVFNWKRDEAVKYNSIIMGCSSAISFGIYMLFVFVGIKISERVLMVSGLLCLAFFYIATFPWPYFTGRLDIKGLPYDPWTPEYNDTFSTVPGWNYTSTVSTPTTTKIELVGCDAKNAWCRYTPRLPLGMYLGAYPLLSIGFPICNVVVSTMFSKILGPRRQGIMQSLMIMSGSCSRLLGPILISILFDRFGPFVAWSMTATVISSSIWILLIFFERIKPLNMKPKLNPGQKIRYDGGVLYKI